MEKGISPIERNPWLDLPIPEGMVLIKQDWNGLLMHWRYWRLEPAGVRAIADEQSRQAMRAHLRDAAERGLLPDFGG